MTCLRTAASDAVAKEVHFGTQNSGLVAKRPIEGAIGLLMLQLLMAVLTDYQSCLNMTRSIISQGLRSSAFGSPAIIDHVAQPVADAVSWQSQISGTFRAGAHQ
eukprot:877359-Amphidinium_carterae.1